MIRYQVTCSLEENRVNPKMNLTVDKVRLYAKDRKTRVNLELRVNEETHWKNAFYVDNQIFDYDDIYMLEVPYEH
jgi:hypothetical protein